MSLTHLHAGAVSEVVKQAISKCEWPFLNESLLNMSHFVADSNLSVPSNADPLFLVADNILSRGLPTLTSVFVESYLAKELSLSRREVSRRTGSVSHVLSSYGVEEGDEDIASLLSRSICMQGCNIEELVHNESDSFGSPEYGSDAEREFLEKVLPSVAPYLTHEVERQRPLNSIISASRANDFTRQRVDFSVQFPAVKDEISGLVIEIDGEPYHEDEVQVRLDQARDRAIREANWEVIHIPASELVDTRKIATKLQGIVSHPYVKLLQNNYSNPVTSTPIGFGALRLALMPMAIARIQKVLLRLLLRGDLTLGEPEWILAIIEREIPFAEIAVADFRRFMGTLFQLEGRGRQIPPVDLHILPAWMGEYDTSRVPRGALVIDVSVLSRFDTILKSESEYGKGIRIRSLYSPRTKRVFNSAKAVEYIGIDSRTAVKLKPLLRDVFRKVSFRQKQVDIISRALQGDSVVALLPTGAGKSLTYQMAALLQPGITIVIDPLKSLMRDQEYNLKKIGIDATAFINSSLSTQARKDVSASMYSNEYLFVFLSPERLQIQDFRNYLQQMKNSAFSFCVVDEAHCVSEWGHDFRTAYLRLGDNVRAFCRGNRTPIPIIALTGTASYDVLSDVQRELGFHDNDEAALIRPERYERPELHFRVVDIPPPDAPIEGIFQMREFVGNAKASALIGLLGDIPSMILSIMDRNGSDKYDSSPRRTLQAFMSTSNSDPNAGLVFCPHKTSIFGVVDIRNRILDEFPFMRGITGSYYGSSDGTAAEEDTLVQVQKDFQNGDLSLLVATKAFGMGIDKANIRFTVHFNIPQSIEAFYQEAGRAGRDRRNSICAVLFCSAALQGEGINTFDKSLMLSFHQNSFKGREKEYALVDELLVRIEFPADSPTQGLATKVYDRFQKPVKINTWIMNGLARLYVNGERFEDKIGYIDLHSKAISTESPKHLDILKYLLDEATESCPPGVSLFTWATSNVPGESRPGIEQRLADSPGIDPPDPLVIGFTNGMEEKILAILKHEDGAWDIGMVMGAYNFCPTFAKFRENLNYQFRKRTRRYPNITDDMLQRLMPLFLKVRKYDDTSKAVYRLSVLGVIKDYVVDYNGNAIIADLANLSDEQYIANLTNYMGRYVSKAEKTGIRAKIENRGEDSVLRKCLGLLLDFVYEWIADKRLEAINTMESAAVVGAHNPDAFDSYIYTYFDSRLAPELQPFIREYGLDTVWNFIERTGGSPDMAKHLRGACNRLLESNPMNAAFLLLRSYANFLIPGERGSTESALRDYKKGWDYFKEQYGWTSQEMRAAIAEFFDRTTQHDIGVANWIGAEIVNNHVEWLKKFTQKYMEDLDYAH